ncbi:MAG: sulfite exporter TauE/SafE family protein [Treponema sp.]|nr:sulfite exporter TauE/SafE family protein [Treponema sp.]
MESSKNRSVTFRIRGMTCINCQTKIEKRLLQLDGLLHAEVSWKKGSAEIYFDETKISLEEIISEIEKLDYKVIRKGGESFSALDSLLYAGIIALLFFALQKTGVMNLLVPGSIASSKMSYALLFVTGLLTSVHCVAMCGGINLSQSLSFVGLSESSTPFSRKIYLPSLLYNLGRLASYTLVGLVLGSVGFFLGGINGGAGGDVSIPLSVQGCLKLIAGVFMLLTGISLLGIFPFLRKVTPHLPSFLSKKIASVQSKNLGPFIVGFLNGFMPCGPLQAMWVLALASGSPLYGALSMLFFCAGTVPFMLGLGSVVSILGKKYSGVVMKIGAVLIVVMGLCMVSQGFALGGWNSAKSESKKSGSEIVIENGKQIVKSKLNPYRYPAITVKKGIPVHWEIEASEESLNGCNYRMIFRDFGFQYQMDYGTNVIEFSPEKSGTFQYTCWMGMVQGSVTVEE